MYSHVYVITVIIQVDEIKVKVVHVRMWVLCMHVNVRKCERMPNECVEFWAILLIGIETLRKSTHVANYFLRSILLTLYFWTK